MSPELLPSIPPAVVVPFIYIGKYVAYPFTVDANIRALELAFEELQAIQKDVTDKIKDGGQLVVDWDRKVNDITEEVNEIAGRYVQPYKDIGTNYNISRKAAKKLPEVKYLIDNGKEILRCHASGVPPPPPAPGVEFQYEKASGGGRKFKLGVFLGRK